ncbi:7140_t:CDS:2 [Scutellospora calospora]|uniref:7140_t:CDS:1 n=1 Tax=Scutellospora calospora TaxID=85575 RepID=A0ACA9K4I6_9GLOM|nr:7140_t:CDS:2 [Scutellospora calospora]
MLADTKDKICGSCTRILLNVHLGLEKGYLEDIAEFEDIKENICSSIQYSALQ